MQQTTRVDDYISLEDREHLLSELHRFLVWVGEKIPEEVEVSGETIKLNELIWRCIHNEEFSDQEKKRFMELVNILEAKEKYNEEMLLKSHLTREEAKQLYHESAALIRTILDLRECEAGKVKLKQSDSEVRQKIDDAKRWLGFLKNIGKKS
ncbi:MAG: methyl-accepting chemotaxis protein [Candidatus Methanoperedens sp.]|nr:methyl-accepting chemotaxis protein [Candidatus Methanoperedens sp.]